MLTRRAKLWILMPCALLLLLVIILLETSFFHVNPIKIGFRRFDFGRCITYSKGEVSDTEIRAISIVMQGDELSHGLQYNSVVQIILCEKQSDLNRFQPFMSASNRRNAVAVAPWPNTIYITPKAKQEYGTIDGVLAHELSHILLLQNYGVANITLLSRRQEWIPEGFAVYLSGWPNYFPEEQLSAKAKEAGVEMANGNLLGIKHAAELSLPIRFMIYRGFVHYLYQRNSSAAVIEFLHEACSHPTKTEAIFEKAFGDSLRNYVTAFSKSIAED
jgi:hypothetical protein